MEAFVNFLALIGVALVPVGILLAIRHLGKKRNLDERYSADPHQEPDYHYWQDQRGRRR
jgi:purine-cytosine permease-like protein